MRYTIWGRARLAHHHQQQEGSTLESIAIENRATVTQAGVRRAFHPSAEALCLAIVGKGRVLLAANLQPLVQAPTY